MDIFNSTPREKFYEILQNANRNLVADEIDKILQKFIAMSMILEQNNPNLQSFINENLDQIYSSLDDMYLHISGEILSKNE
ncbi:hypothetical protein CR66_02330 [Campylobacter mucosalis]|uniref:DUF2018 family protein n=1 Tax=Campylobacter mucosalis TaxID=202 RepID=UPI0004D3543D|nr:DUF2018 family protein [Campylobacter mucosalis]KEA46672.1 hypothetical protein CR66_02330 [Campylobacter mucosalis]QKF62804.1 DUF2018 domain-containing protein [Campylobacter mucosalis]